MNLSPYIPIIRRADDYVEYVSHFLGGFPHIVSALCHNPVADDPFSILVLAHISLTKTDGETIESGRAFKKLVCVLSTFMSHCL